MKFLLNDTIINDKTLASDLTALRYLREHRGLTGTKEGCASGDCGACTLLIGSIEDGQLTYATINSCITPIHSLAGKHIVSIEYLSAKTGELHPAQRAMVASHGSQCGFCTPGFVLSLAGLYEQRACGSQTLDRQRVCDAISGNLCRCTGYRPIIEAGLAMSAVPATPSFMRDDHGVKAQLEALHAAQHENDVYLQPRTIEQLVNAKKAHPDAAFIAGGTDLMLEHTQRFHDFGALIDLTHVTELKQIQVTEQHLIIGAAVTYSELEAFFNPVDYPQFATLLSRIASRQIRNRGTIGGNIANASPIADLPPVLLAFDAEIQLVKIDGSRRMVSIHDFYVDYKQTVLAADEFIASFTLERDKLTHFHRFYKVSKRMEDDISSVMLAVRFAVSEGKITAVRLAFGGMAATPIRVTDAEHAFCQQASDDTQAFNRAIEQLQQALKPMSDMRASARYRLDVACNLVKKAWLELNGTDMLTFSGHALPDMVLVNSSDKSGYKRQGDQLGRQGGRTHA